MSMVDLRIPQWSRDDGASHIRSAHATWWTHIFSLCIRGKSDEITEIEIILRVDTYVRVDMRASFE